MRLNCFTKKYPFIYQMQIYNQKVGREIRNILISLCRISNYLINHFIIHDYFLGGRGQRAMEALHKPRAPNGGLGA